MAYLDSVTRLGPGGGPRPQYVGFSPAAATAVVTGTSFTESDLVSGHQTVITLSNDTWVAAGVSFDAVRQAIIDGDTSAQSETFGFNNEIRDKQSVTGVARTSDTVVTITWSAAPAYDITADEVRTVTIPATALTGGNAVVASPNIGVTADVESTEEEIRSGGYGFLNSYDSYRQKKRRRKKRLGELLEQLKELDPVDREIAELIHKDDEREQQEASIAELERLVAQSFSNKAIPEIKAYNERVAKAFTRAYMQGNYSAYEALEREMERAREEEDFLFLAMIALD